mmetsp:Transcript_79385/g.157300  ORF Transcript_79385/g.157300 Transcript_79385/m.157300 type:complete len:215 (-) Transcript_79385:158-802(-)
MMSLLPIYPRCCQPVCLLMIRCRSPRLHHLLLLHSGPKDQWLQLHRRASQPRLRSACPRATLSRQFFAPRDSSKEQALQPPAVATLREEQRHQMPIVAAHIAPPTCYLCRAGHVGALDFHPVPVSTVTPHQGRGVLAVQVSPPLLETACCDCQPPRPQQFLQRLHRPLPRPVCRCCSRPRRLRNHQLAQQKRHPFLELLWHCLKTHRVTPVAEG